MKDKPEILAIIPVLLNASETADRYLKHINGIPLLAYSIIHARHTPSISRTIVITSNEKVADTARQWGADVVEGPGNGGRPESAILHLLKTLKESDNYDPDFVALLQVNFAYRKDSDLKEALDKIIGEEADSLFSCYHLATGLWSKQAEPISLPSNHGDYLIENGSIYIFRPEIFKETGTLLGGKITYFEQGSLETLFSNRLVNIEFTDATLNKFNITQKRELDLCKIKLLVFDFDGVMTNNKVYVNQDGVEMVMADRGDGWGIGKLKKTGLDMAIISTEVNPVVSARAKKLKLTCHQDCPDKLSLIKELAAEKNLRPEEIAFVGNDENDLEAMHWVGLPIAVANAESTVLPHAKIVTKRNGGDGAVREICELFYTAITKAEIQRS